MKENDNASLAAKNSTSQAVETGDQLGAGGWYVEEGRGRSVVVGKYTLRAHWQGLGDEGEIKTIMRLVAAAPDLLAACKEFVRKVDNFEARSTRSYEQMKASIAKAEGRSGDTK